MPRHPEKFSATLFAYGTLMEDAVLAAVTGKRFVSRPGVLTGYERLTVRGEVYPGIRPCQGARISGRIYSRLDAETLTRLDAFEGELYVRQQLTVHDTATGRSLTAETYVIAPAHSHCLSDQPWDPEHFRARHLQAFLAAYRQDTAQH